jgi:hypothetical protein
MQYNKQTVLKQPTYYSHIHHNTGMGRRATFILPIRRVDVRYQRHKA